MIWLVYNRIALTKLDCLPWREQNSFSFAAYFCWKQMNTILIRQTIALNQCLGMIDSWLMYVSSSTSMFLKNYRMYINFSLISVLQIFVIFVCYRRTVHIQLLNLESFFAILTNALLILLRSFANSFDKNHVAMKRNQQFYLLSI